VSEAARDDDERDGRAAPDAAEHRAAAARAEVHGEMEGGSGHGKF